MRPDEESSIPEHEKHPDFLDQANIAAQNMVSDGMAHVRRAAEREQQRLGKPTGFCLYCEAETMDPTARFCDAECSAAWQHEQDCLDRNRGEG